MHFFSVSLCFCGELILPANSRNSRMVPRWPCEPIPGGSINCESNSDLLCGLGFHLCVLSCIFSPCPCASVVNSFFQRILEIHEWCCARHASRFPVVA